jgi:hypothetical protein
MENLQNIFQAKAKNFRKIIAMLRQIKILQRRRNNNHDSNKLFYQAGNMFPGFCVL